jgi:1-acyl-sn-glycerol-3-phosphate acyltransferase
VVLLVCVYFAAGPFGYAAFAILSLFPAKDREARARRLQGIIRFAFGHMHDVLRALGILDFDRHAFSGANIPSGPCVIIANHPTLTDTSALIGVLDNVTTAVKPSVFHSWAKPLLTQAAAFRGPGDDPMSVQSVLDEATDRLSRGYRVLMFPEGTRSPPSGPGPFGRAAFEIAVRANVPVVPIVITCDPPWLAKEHSFLSPPSDTPKLTLRALPAVHPEAAGACSRTLRDMVSGAVRAALSADASPLTASQESTYVRLT